MQLSNVNYLHFKVESLSKYLKVGFRSVLHVVGRSSVCVKCYLGSSGLDLVYTIQQFLVATVPSVWGICLVSNGVVETFSGTNVKESKINSSKNL